MVTATAVRHKLAPRGISPAKAARYMGLTWADFHKVLPRLSARGYPRPDPDTGMYDLTAINRWMDVQHADNDNLSPADQQRARIAALYG